jgi:hypothetical protein
MSRSPLPHLTDFVGGQPIAAEQTGYGPNLIAPQSGRSIATIAESGKSADPDGPFRSQARR